MKRLLIIGISFACIGIGTGYVFKPFLYEKKTLLLQIIKQRTLTPTLQQALIPTPVVQAPSVAPAPLLAPTGPFAYDYSKAVFDLPVMALTNQKAFSEWQQNFKQEFIKIVDAVPIEPYTRATLADEVLLEKHSENSYSLYNITFTTYNNEQTSGGLLAIPHTIDSTKPLIIALHGHEEPQQAVPAIDNFNNQKWMHILAQAGHIVYAPISMEHSTIADLAQIHGYHAVWTKKASLAMDRVLADLSTSIPHKEQIIMGLSAGGIVGICLTAFRNDIASAVFAGANQNLDFLRKEYRILTHPDCWDIYQLQSYLPLLALLIPKPIMFQDGTQDTFYPRKDGVEPQEYYSGLTRGILTEEFIAPSLILRHVWQTDAGTQNKLPCVYIHEGGHAFIPDIALQFIEGERSFCQ